MAADLGGATQRGRVQVGGDVECHVQGDHAEDVGAPGRAQGVQVRGGQAQGQGVELGRAKMRLGGGGRGEKTMGNIKQDIITSPTCIACTAMVR